MLLLIFVVRKFLSVDMEILVENVMVSRHLDYCNSLLYGVTKSKIAKLKRVQNALCCIIYRLERINHIIPYLKNSSDFLLRP